MPIIGQFTSEALKIGDTKVENPNDLDNKFVFPNWQPRPAYFSSNRIVWPRTKPPQMIPFFDTVDKRYQATYGMSYLKYWFYLKTEDIRTSQSGEESEYEKLFIENSGYIRDPQLKHGALSDPTTTIWYGVWQFDSVDIQNLKGNISQINVQISKQIVSTQIIDPTAAIQ